MKLRFTLVGAAVLLTLARLPLTAAAQVPKPHAVPVASASASASAPGTVIDEPQRHFTAAVEAYAKKDYKTAAAEVRKGESYVRPESARAVGDVKKGLNAADAELDRTAKTLDKGAVKTDKGMDKAFADTNHALALAHRARAAQSWADKAYGQAGYELKASAQDLEDGAAWAGTQAKAAATGAAADTRALGDKLASGGVWAKDEVVKGFDTLGNALDKFGETIGSKTKAAHFDAGK